MAMTRFEIQAMPCRTINSQSRSTIYREYIGNISGIFPNFPIYSTCRNVAIHVVRHRYVEGGSSNRKKEYHTVLTYGRFESTSSLRSRILRTRSSNFYFEKEDEDCDLD